ncbi:MAG: hypothetical protein RLT87_09945 [Gammaproteobacteria bacterium]
MKDSKKPTIFTPDNEPYLGEKSLLAFDKSISAILEVNYVIAPATHNIKLNELQLAASQIIPSAISLSLSIRELIRQGYLYGALVMLRPFIERVVTMQYLSTFNEKLELWHDGWLHNKRPSLNKMINELWGDKFPDAPTALTKSLNSLMHGDPHSSSWNLVTSKTGDPAYAVSKITNKPELCNSVALDAATWLNNLMVLMLEIFSNEFKKS